MQDLDQRVQEYQGPSKLDVAVSSGLRYLMTGLAAVAVAVTVPGCSKGGSRESSSSVSNKRYDCSTPQNTFSNVFSALKNDPRALEGMVVGGTEGVIINYKVNQRLYPLNVGVLFHPQMAAQMRVFEGTELGISSVGVPYRVGNEIRFKTVKELTEENVRVSPEGMPADSKVKICVVELTYHATKRGPKTISPMPGYDFVKMIKVDGIWKMAGPLDLLGRMAFPPEENGN
jgi:hypothetical protein